MTLIETMMATLLVIMVMGAAMVFWKFFQTNTSFAFSQSQSAEEAASVVERLARDLRQATIAADGSFPLNLAEDNALAFHADINGDGIAERIRYRLNGASLERGVIIAQGDPASYSVQNETMTTVADHIVNTGPMFAYYNGDWPEDTTNNPLPPAQRFSGTRLITITLMVQQNNDADPITISRTIHLRGLENL